MRNMDILNKVFIFAAGVAIGSAVTWKYLNRVREEEFEEDTEEESEEESESKKYYELGKYFQEGFEKGLTSYNKILKKESYKEEEDEDDMVKPYVIPPEEFGDPDVDYETKSLVMYADKVLVNEYGAVIEDVDNLVGRDSLNHFGEYEDDSVFVRNEELATDFEILLDNRNYKDISEEE